MERPLANSYWVLPGRFLAGEYPTGRELPDSIAGRARIGQLLAAGISCIVDLTEEGECPAYAQLLPPSIVHLRRAIPDTEAPRHSGLMRGIQTDLALALAGGRNLYVHCRAGIGRTGTAVGCFLVEQGLDGDDALRELNVLWTLQCARAASWPEVPQTPEQANYIRLWIPQRAAPSQAMLRLDEPGTES
jgi:hypothetical protein